MKLSPVQLYYLKKELIKLEIEREWKYLQTSCVDLSNLLSIPIEDSSFFTTSDLPFIRFIFQQFIKPFPLLKNQSIEQQDLFWNQCQLFLQEWYEHQPFTWMPPTTHEYQERRAMVSKLKKMMIAFLNLLVESDKKEKHIPLTIDALQKSQDNNGLNIDTLTSLTTEKRMNIIHHSNLYKVNIISAQFLTLSIQKQSTYNFNLLSSSLSTTTNHLYFIIELTNINNNTVHYVARRHKEFRLLAKKLRSQFPERNDIPLVPNKIRKKENNNESNIDELLGEMDRRRLKHYLYQLLLIPQICQSQLFTDFLLLSSSSSLISSPSSAKIQYDQLNEEDINKRKLLDDQFLKEQENYQKYIDDTLNSLENDLLLLKQQLMKPGGCIKILNVIKATPDWNDLPEYIKKCFDWGSLCFAFTLHKQLVVSDLAIENRNQLKKTHAFLPYRTLSVLLKFSNPIKMVKGMLDLFLARPFGGSSLMQRVISLNLQEELDSIQKDIKELEDRIDPMICNKLKQAVLTERRFEEHDNLEGLSSKDALLFILKHPDIQPILTSQLQSIRMEESIDTQKENVTVYWKDVQRIWYLYGKRQDQEQWMDLLLQGSTGILLQSIVSTLYSPLAEIYQAADLAKTLYDLKDFMEDLIDVVQLIEQKQQENEELFLASSKENTQLFIDLVYRHQSSFYQFVHKVHTQSKSTLFTDLIEFADHWLKQIQKQEVSSLSLKRKWKIDEFWDAVALNRHDEVQLMKDIDILCNYHRSRKLYTLEKRQYRMKIMMTQQNENEWSNYWSDDDDDDDDEGNVDEDGNYYKNNISHLMNNKAPIPPLIPTPSLILPKLLPTFINQIITVLTND